MKTLNIDISGCSYQELKNAAEKCGFIIKTGKRHCKVKSLKGEFITTIPYHTKIDKFTAKSIVKRFQKFGCQINF